MVLEKAPQRSRGEVAAGDGDGVRQIILDGLRKGHFADRGHLGEEGGGEGFGDGADFEEGVFVGGALGGEVGHAVGIEGAAGGIGDADDDGGVVPVIDALADAVLDERGDGRRGEEILREERNCEEGAREKQEKWRAHGEVLLVDGGVSTNSDGDQGQA